MRDGEFEATRTEARFDPFAVNLDDQFSNRCAALIALNAEADIVARQHDRIWKRSRPDGLGGSPYGRHKNSAPKEDGDAIACRH